MSERENMGMSDQHIAEMVKGWYTKTAKGDYIPSIFPSKDVKGFTAAHWFLPEELKDLFERHGVQVLEMAACEGSLSHHVKETNRLFKDKEKWNAWIDIIIKTCNHPSIVGGS